MPETSAKPKAADFDPSRDAEMTPEQERELLDWRLRRPQDVERSCCLFRGCREVPHIAWVCADHLRCAQRGDLQAVAEFVAGSLKGNCTRKGCGREVIGEGLLCVPCRQEVLDQAPGLRLPATVFGAELGRPFQTDKQIAAGLRCKDMPLENWPPRTSTGEPRVQDIEGRCRVAGCTLDSYRRGLCSAGYQRANLGGTLEEVGLPSKAAAKKKAQRKAAKKRSKPPIGVPLATAAVKTSDTGPQQEATPEALAPTAVDPVSTPSDPGPPAAVSITPAVPGADPGSTSPEAALVEAQTKLAELEERVADLRLDLDAARVTERRTIAISSRAIYMANQRAGLLSRCLLAARDYHQAELSSLDFELDARSVLLESAQGAAKRAQQETQSVCAERDLLLLQADAVRPVLVQVCTALGATITSESLPRLAAALRGRLSELPPSPPSPSTGAPSNCGAVGSREPASPAARNPTPKNGPSRSTSSPRGLSEEEAVELAMFRAYDLAFLTVESDLEHHELERKAYAIADLLRRLMGSFHSSPATSPQSPPSRGGVASPPAAAGSTQQAERPAGPSPVHGDAPGGAGPRAFRVQGVLNQAGEVTLRTELAGYLPPTVVDAGDLVWLTTSPPDDSAADQAFNDIARACGIEAWNYPGQLVRDVRKLVEMLQTLAAVYDKGDEQALADQLSEFRSGPWFQVFEVSQ